MPQEAAEKAAGPSHSPTASKRTRTEWIRFVGYWIATLLVAQENVAGSLWLWLKLEYVRANLVHLGYRLTSRESSAFAAPRCGRPTRPRLWTLKEWAYAGMFFNYSAAVFRTCR